MGLANGASSAAQTLFQISNPGTKEDKIIFVLPCRDDQASTSMCRKPNTPLASTAGTPTWLVGRNDLSCSANLSQLFCLG